MEEQNQQVSNENLEANQEENMVEESKNILIAEDDEFNYILLKEVNMTEYGAEGIQVMEGLQAVRKRPGMYIGSTNSRGLHHLINEVVDNSIVEALAGHTASLILYRYSLDTLHQFYENIPFHLHQKY